MDGLIDERTPFELFMDSSWKSDGVCKVELYEQRQEDSALQRWLGWIESDNGLLFRFYRSSGPMIPCEWLTLEELEDVFLVKTDRPRKSPLPFPVPLTELHGDVDLLDLWEGPLDLPDLGSLVSKLSAALGDRSSSRGRPSWVSAELREARFPSMISSRSFPSWRSIPS